MKKFPVTISAIIAALLFLSCSTPPEASQSRAMADGTLTYAEILEGCVLYSDGELTFPVTTLPETYFVCVIEQNENAVRVTYKNLDGYVRPECVSVCDFIPKTKFAASYLSLSNDGGTINVRSAPDNTKDNVVKRLTDGTKLYYYGTAEGTIQNQLLGAEWYCVSLGEGKIGYVYRMYAAAPELPDNVIEAIAPPSEPDVTPEAVTAAGGEYFLIAALCLPVIVLMYLLFKSRKSE